MENVQIILNTESTLVCCLCFYAPLVICYLLVCFECILVLKFLHTTVLIFFLRLQLFKKVLINYVH